MPSASPSEASRFELLRSLDILDSTAGPAFDALVRTASLVCRCPISLMSLIDVDRQWFKSAIGFEATETPRDQAFCAHAIQGKELFEIPNALDDGRFAKNPLVTGDSRIRFYAGQPIVFQGVSLGTLCVMDRVPRELSEEQRTVLADLSLTAAELLHGRLEAMLHHRETKRLESFARLSGDWLWESDVLHRCTWLSSDTTEASGLFYGTILGERFRDLHVLDWVGRRASDVPLFKLLDAGEPFSQVVVATVTPEGPRYIALSAEPLLDDTDLHCGYRGSARDVTDRVEFEVASREREAAFKKIASQIPGVIYQFRYSRDGVPSFPYASDGLRDIFEISPDDVASDASLLLGRLHPKDIVAFNQSIASSIRDRSVWHARFRVRLPVKGIRWLQGSSIPERLPDGGTLWHGFIADVTESHARDRDLVDAYEALQAKERWLRVLTDNLPALITHVDADERYTFVNRRRGNTFGSDSDRILGRTVREVRGEAIYHDIKPRIDRAMAGEVVTFESCGEVDGVFYDYQATYVPDVTPDGVCRGVYAMSFDITARKFAESRLAANERLLRDITDNLPVLISYVDADERMTYANDTFLTSIGVTREALIGRKAIDALGSILYAQGHEYMRRALDGERVKFEIESVLAGESKYLHATYLPDIAADGRVLGITTMSVDVTDLKAAERRLSDLAHFDALTGLPNRLLFTSRLEEAVATALSSGSRQALMFLDFDHFKAVNDTHGHAVGDAVLQGFVRRITQSVRPDDFVARLAGDEFVVLLGTLADVDEARAIAQRIVDDIDRPFEIEGERLTVHVTASVGVAMRASDCTSGSAIMAKADQALYLAKEAGRNTFRVAA